MRTIFYSPLVIGVLQQPIVESGIGVRLGPTIVIGVRIDGKLHVTTSRNPNGGHTGAMAASLS